MKNIFPKEILENTVEVYRFKHKVKSKIIYGILLSSIICTVVSLPYIFLDIYSTARGIVRSEKERNQLISLYSGKIKELNIQENKYVEQGDTLLVIDNSIGQKKSDLLSKQLEELELRIKDLMYLSSSAKIINKRLQSIEYQKEHIQYVQKLRELQTRYSKAKSDFERQDKLYKKEVIARVEYENSKYNLDLTMSELSYYEKQKRNQWQSELAKKINREEELQSNLLQNKEDQKKYIIIATINGTIQNLQGLEVGNFITANTPIAEISPDTDLIAECYVTPSDIGLLKQGTKIKFQIDAFNFNQWGMATGNIIAISNDISIINNVPMFKVTCSIDQEILRLKNGFEGKLKKGMTFNARFFIVNRSAFDLLYDKVDDWINPSKNSN